MSSAESSSSGDEYTARSSKKDHKIVNIAAGYAGGIWVQIPSVPSVQVQVSLMDNQLRTARNPAQFWQAMLRIGMIQGLCPPIKDKAKRLNRVMSGHINTKKGIISRWICNQRSDMWYTFDYRNQRIHPSDEYTKDVFSKERYYRGNCAEMTAAQAAWDSWGIKTR